MKFWCTTTGASSHSAPALIRSSLIAEVLVSRTPRHTPADARIQPP